MRNYEYLIEETKDAKVWYPIGYTTNPVKDTKKQLKRERTEKRWYCWRYVLISKPRKP